MTALAMFGSVTVVVAGGLVAFRWWLAAGQARSALVTRIEALEAWKSRNEMGKLR